MSRVINTVGSFVLAACVLLVVASSAHAQTPPDTTPINADFISEHGLRNLENAVSIFASPQHPGPGDTVQFLAESPLFNLDEDYITWNVNGTVIGEGGGTKTASAVVDARGTPLDVVLTVTDPVWGVAKYEFILVPLQLDLLYDAPTYVPPFYRGRLMPSAGGTMRLQALARFVRDGELVKESDIIYSWKRNGIVLGSFSGLGKSNITISSPALYDTDTISVQATTKEGGLSAVASALIPNVEPIPALYENHPLFGIMFHRMTPREMVAPSELAVIAVPYFVSSPGLFDQGLEFNWYLNDTPVAASSTRRNELQIIAGEGPARLRLQLTHTRNFFLDSKGDWTFNFGGAAGAAGASAPQDDIFHSNNPDL